MVKLSKKQKIAAVAGASVLGAGAIFGGIGAGIVQNQRDTERLRDEIAQSQISDYEAVTTQRIEELKNALISIAKGCSNLHDQLDKITHVTEYNRPVIDQLRTNICDIEDDCFALQKQFATLKKSSASNAQLASEVSELESKVLALSEKVFSISVEISKLQSEQSNFQTEIQQETIKKQQEELERIKTEIYTNKIKYAISNTFENSYTICRLGARDIVASNGSDYIEDCTNYFNYKTGNLKFAKTFEDGKESIYYDTSTLADQFLATISSSNAAVVSHPSRDVYTLKDAHQTIDFCISDTDKVTSYNVTIDEEEQEAVSIQEITKNDYDTYVKKASRQLTQYQRYETLQNAVEKTFTGFVKGSSEYSGTENGTDLTYVSENNYATHATNTNLNANAYTICANGLSKVAVENNDGSVELHENEAEYGLGYIRDNFLGFYAEKFEINFDESTMKYDFVDTTSSTPKPIFSLTLNENGEITSRSQTYQGDNFNLTETVALEKITEEEFNAGCAQIMAKYQELAERANQNSGEME